MKAIQLQKTGTPDVLKYVDVDCPVPGKGQALIKVTAVSVGYGDILMRQGVVPIPLPGILGVECSGVIAAVGENVAHLALGQPVIAVVPSSELGCYAEYVVTDTRHIIPIPDNLDLDMAAALPIAYLTAYHMLHTTVHIKAGQTILLYAAAGGVGTAVIQLAHLSGATVIGLTSSTQKKQYCQEQGADYVLNYKTEDICQRVQELTSGQGVDFVLNSIGGNTLENDFAMLAPLGQIVLFGMTDGFPQSNLLELLMMHMAKNAGVRSFTLNGLDAELIIQPVAQLIQYLCEGKIKPQIYQKIPLYDAAKAHKLLESQVVQGRLILKP